MDRKNERNLTDAEQRFTDKYSDAMQTDDDRIAEFRRPVDYSFLDAAPERTPVKHPKRFLRAACILLGVFIAGSGMAVWINSQPANAGRFAIEKNFYSLKSMLSGEGSENDEEGSENLISYEVNDINKVVKIKKSIPALSIPQYIPDGYKLEKLAATKDVDGNFTASYLFQNNDKALWINEYNEDADNFSELFSDGEIIESDGIQLYVWQDGLTEQWSVNRLKDNVMIVVLGDVSQAELIQVVKFMQ